ncbi:MULTISPECIES: hypothetical protein [Fusobacterium]|mgnify:CR=1 FL=1|uniref:DnaD domain protein n=1 Tax=Fusobacterium mortiferum ATCC 9817 TaxID=469616 RepID=A0ABN5JD54_FUSMR|nr:MULTISPECIES: hypothetical protein [Fusobacterium]AVQ19607.1 hypothetical protein C4N19_11110 [Fusobacterium mortiferum ATCC 9817]EEO35971.1 hypothetical protein FMAG_01533 [Fusobacterium mortiferum ATCC 9817]MSS60669.1 hypothetical protein [Fusobacterium sp. FSA-380-WT-2B]
MEKNSIKQLLMASNFYILNKHLVKTLGIETAFFLTALVEADEILADKNGWFYQTIPQIEKMTGLTKHKQTNCINELLILGILLQENKGMPMKRYFKLDYEKIAKLLSSHKKDNSQEDREGDSKEEKNQSAREEKNCHLGREKIDTNKELYINNLDKKLKTTKLDNLVGIESKSSSSSSFENSFSEEKERFYQIKSALENYGLGVETCRNIMELVKNGRVNFERINSVLGVAKEKAWGEGAIYKALRDNWEIRERDKKVFSEKELRKKLSSKVNILLDDYEKGRTNYEDMIEEYLEFSLNSIFSENLKVEYYEKMRKASEEITSKIA